MSWHYLPELVAACSDQSFSAIESSVPWKRSTIAERCSCVGSATACFLCSQSGTTSEHLIACLGVAAWIWSLPDSRANPSPLPDDRPPQATSETCGPKPSESCAKWDHASWSWRTFPGSSPGSTGTSEPFLGTWPKQGSMRNGELFQRPKSAHPICASDSGLLPTPSAQNYGTNQGGGAGRVGPVRMSLETMARKNHWPTHRSSPNENRQFKPTPSQLSGKHGLSLASEVGGPLNPDWVEWLMGWPIGWTDLRPLAMARFQEWFEQHGRA